MIHQTPDQSDNTEDDDNDDDDDDDDDVNVEAAILEGFVCFLIFCHHHLHWYFHNSRLLFMFVSFDSCIKKCETVQFIC